MLVGGRVLAGARFEGRVARSAASRDPGLARTYRLYSGCSCLVPGGVGEEVGDGPCAEGTTRLCGDTITVETLSRGDVDVDLFDGSGDLLRTYRIEAREAASLGFEVRRGKVDDTGSASYDFFAPPLTPDARGAFVFRVGEVAQVSTLFYDDEGRRLRLDFGGEFRFREPPVNLERVPFQEETVAFAPKSYLVTAPGAAVLVVAGAGVEGQIAFDALP